MGIFNGQFSNVVEWEEFRDDVIFWKWHNREIKKSSRLIIRPGQDAIAIHNGKIEGIFTDEGNYEIESEIIPFLSSLKGFRFGFNSGLRLEVLFVNTKEFTVKWGTKNAINIPAPGLPGGMPIRSFGTFSFKIDDYITLIDKVAGVKESFTVDEVKERVMSVLDQVFMRSIVKEGKDMFNLQMNATAIGNSVREDLDMQLLKLGLTVTEFSIANFSYPEEIQTHINKSAAAGMVGNMDQYQRVATADAIGSGGAAGEAASGAMGMAMGMAMAGQMMNQQQQAPPVRQPAAVPPSTHHNGSVSCPSCGISLPAGAKFCPDCGAKAVAAKKFCAECGASISSDSKFCPECGTRG